MSAIRWVPLIVLGTLAILFEPIRSGLVFENQSCDFNITPEKAWAALFNVRHLIGYGVLFLAAATALGKNQVWVAGLSIFSFSTMLEVQQSFLVTGHCRLWDLIPNVASIGLAAMLFMLGSWLMKLIARP